MQNECNLFHLYNWIQFFVSMYNDTRTNNNDFRLKESNITLTEFYYYYYYYCLSLTEKVQIRETLYLKLFY
jgi:hypothetical protein